jgi:hypothetical protein
MVTLNLEEIKLQFMNSIRTYLYPQQTVTTNSVSLYDNTIVSGTFNIFSESINSYGVYVSQIDGSPNPFVMSIYNGSRLLAASTINGTVGWNTISCSAVEDIVTSRASSIVITGDMDGSNNYYFATNNTGNLAFTVRVTDFVYKIFPIKQIDSDNLPVVVVDVDGRPIADERYLTGDQIWFYFNIKAEVYSKYTQEIDRIISMMDNGIGRDREGFATIGIKHISHNNISKLEYVKPEVYTRNVTWRIRQLVTR